MKGILILQIFFIFCVFAAQKGEKDKVYLLKITSIGQSDMSNYEISKLIKQMNYDEFIEIQQESCNEQEVCPYIILHDYRGNVIKQFDGIASIGRIRESIVENIKKGHLKTKKVKKGNTVHQYLSADTQSVKVAEKRNRLMEAEEPEDWQKTTFSTRGAQSANKMMSVSNHQKDEHAKSEIVKEKPQKIEQKINPKNQLRADGHQQDAKKVTISPSKNIVKGNAAQEDKQGAKIQQKGTHIVEVKGTWQWRFGYVVMIILLLMGMKYMKREEVRMEKISVDDEAESLSSQ